MRFAINFEPAYRWLSTALGLPPSTAYVDVASEEIDVRMGWAFRSRFRPSDVSSAAAVNMRPRMMGIPVRLRELLVSVEDAAGLVRALRG